MASLKTCRFPRSERGAELVEFAIAMPIMLMLMAGIVDFALLFQSWEVTTNAAREGARLAVLPGYDVNGYGVAQQRVADYIAAGGAQGAFATQITQVPLTACGQPGSGVRVAVTYTHSFLIIGPVVGLINGTFLNTVSYTTSTVMRSEIQTLIPCP